MDDNKVVLQVETTGRSGKKYNGSFEVRLYLTHRERGDASREFAKKSIGILSDDDVYYVFKSISVLNKHIIDKPEWWGDGYELFDSEPIFELAKQLKDAQDNYAKEQSGEVVENPEG